MNVICIWIIDQCDTKIDFIIFSQVSNLHFVVQMILPYVLKVRSVATRCFILVFICNLFVSRDDPLMS